MKIVKFLLVLGLVGVIVVYGMSKLVKPKSQPITENKSFAKIDCPDIETIDNKLLQAEVNKTIKEKIAKIDTSEGETTITCVPVRSDSKIFSMKFMISSYGEGAAHPNQETRTLNYSIDYQKELELKDLFKPGSNYLQLLSCLSRTQLKAKLAGKTIEMIDGGTLPKETSFSNFLVEKTGLTVIFNPYEVSPYSEGTQEIMIKSGEMKPGYLY